ncbi:helix-turn-helix domain-containing protein [Roseovarius sp.]|uniref:helix-turn-helix domain-containing protein n=1 Tax=Roseovarius sp. TaxID=1486281 RepID=UPI00261CA714|nr:helix-turn-helix domain-containing protein [Roseovarius sp.]
MTQRKPLDLMQKWLVSQYWIRQDPPLTRASFAVLMRLLDRQNPKTGRCDPSAVGLMEETGFSERSIRGAFAELEERGALIRYRAARRSRNQFLIFSVDELGQNARLAELKMRGAKRVGMHPVAATPAIRCRSNLKRPAPETIKETKKKKENAERMSVSAAMSRAQGQRQPSEAMALGEFERRVVKVFERKGFGYMGLMKLPARELELAHSQMLAGELSFSKAVGRLLETYESLSKER